MSDMFEDPIKKRKRLELNKEFEKIPPRPTNFEQLSSRERADYLAKSRELIRKAFEKVYGENINTGNLNLDFQPGLMEEINPNLFIKKYGGSLRRKKKRKSTKRRKATKRRSIKRKSIKRKSTKRKLNKKTRRRRY